VLAPLLRNQRNLDEWVNRALKREIEHQRAVRRV
jgi:hypothetical protein